MSSKSRSTLSRKRILLSLLIIILIPVSALLLNRYMEFYDLSLMFSLTIGGSILIVYDWNLYAVHYNRSKYDPGNTILYTLIGCILIGTWTWISQNFFHCNAMIPDSQTLIGNGYARPGMITAYSFMLASVISIGFKCITDHMNVRSREIVAILISAITAGFFFTVIFITEFAPLLWIQNLLYNMILFAILSYLYNQSTSFMPGLISFTLIHLAFMIISIL